MIKLLHIALSHGKNGLTDALRGICDEYAEIPTSHPDLNAEICRVLDSFNPTIVWIQIQNDGLTEQSLHKLRDHSAFVINWTGDVRAVIPDCYFFYAKFVDVTCFSNMNDVRTMRSLGWEAEFLQIGYDPAIYYPDPAAPKSRDIVFMANNHSMFPQSQFRAQLVSDLQRYFGDRFGVYGSGWNPSVGNYMGDQKGEADIYRGAKIAISVSNFKYERYFSDRLIRAMGSGCCVVSHHYPGIEVDFNIVNHFLVAIPTFDFIDKINLLLNNDELRQKISQQGFEYCKKNFTFDKMAKDIISIYTSRL